MYDVYYTTGAGPWVNAGTDIWVNNWMNEISPKLDVKPILLIHRNKPKTHVDYKFPIETHWHGENMGKFNELCKGARRINILHGHYTPLKSIVDNKDKIHSNILHNSIDHIIKSSVGSDVPFVWHPYMSTDWEREINKKSKHTIWVGLYDILYDNERITNFYEFTHNKRLSESTNIGFTARAEGRKNPHYLDGLESFIFTNSTEFNMMWKEKAGLNFKKSKIYHYKSEFKDKFYNMDWGISHSAFTSEPFGYSIFESVDRGKLPIIHKTWCTELEYPYRVSTKKEFSDIYKQIQSETWEERNKWFKQIKNFMMYNYTDKNKWIESLLKIYNN